MVPDQGTQALALGAYCSNNDTLLSRKAICSCISPPQDAPHPRLGLWEAQGDTSRDTRRDPCILRPFLAGWEGWASLAAGHTDILLLTASSHEISSHRIHVYSLPLNSCMVWIPWPVFPFVKWGWQRNYGRDEMGCSPAYSFHIVPIWCPVASWIPWVYVSNQQGISTWYTMHAGRHGMCQCHIFTKEETNHQMMSGSHLLSNTLLHLTDYFMHLSARSSKIFDRTCIKVFLLLLVPSWPLISESPHWVPAGWGSEGGHLWGVV